jgi:DNA-binding NarL/FixJ family response regulator
MKVLVADDHPFTLQGTKSYIESIRRLKNLTQF